MATLSKCNALNGIKRMHMEIVEGNIDHYTDVMVTLKMTNLDKIHKEFTDKHELVLQEFENNVAPGKEMSPEDNLKIDALNGLYWTVDDMVLLIKSVLMDKGKKVAQVVKKDEAATDPDESV